MNLDDVLIKTNIFAWALRLQKTSSRCLQDFLVSIRLDHTSSRHLKDVLKTFWRGFQDVFKTSSRRLQNIFQTSSKNVFKTSSRRLPKTSSRHLEDVLQTSSRHLEDVLQRYIQGVFKTYHQVKVFLLTRLQEVFNTFLRRYFPKTIIHRGICLGNTTFEKFMTSVQNLQER